MPHSAHSVSPYEAFSTLQPVTIRPSSTSPAQPTGNREYGAYARRIAAMAASRSADQSTSGSPMSRLHVRLTVRRRRPDLPDQARHREEGGEVRRHLQEVGGDLA